MSEGNSNTAEQLQKAVRDRDGWNGAVIRAARRILTTGSGADWLLNMRELARCLEKFDQCAKAVQLLEHSLELEKALAAQQPDIDPEIAEFGRSGKPRRRRGR